MEMIDKQFLETPWYGSRQMARHMQRQGHKCGRHRVRRLMRLMGFVLTKVRNATWRSQYDVGVMALFLFLHLPFCRAVYAVFFGGSMPRVSRSFSSEKSYSPSMLM
ncbi:IS3 family transposase [Parasedimentitalea maritima]